MVERKRDTSKKRNAILDAAVKGFQEEGYDNTSMDTIAALAGASKRTVYNHFPSKEILFKEVINRFVDETHSLKQITYRPNRRLADQLSEFAEVKIAVTQNPSWLGLIKVALGVFIRYPELAKETMERAEAGDDTFITWLKAAASDNRMHVENPTLVSNVFWSMVSGAFFWPAVFQAPSHPDTVNKLKDELIHTFLARYGCE